MDLHLPFEPPLEPMLAKASDDLPTGDGWLFEPKWDGFRAIVFRDGDELLIQSRDLKPLDRYFPELAAPLKAALPERCVVDGEVVIAADGRLAFESLLLRIHPAASRVKLLAAETPASFVAWDLLALDDRDLRGVPQGERRALLEGALTAPPQVHLTPATRDRAWPPTGSPASRAPGWTGSSPSPSPASTSRASARCSRSSTSAPRTAWWPASAGTRTARARTSDRCSWACSTTTGSLHHVGITRSFTWERRATLLAELEPLRTDALAAHPWAEWAEWASAGSADASGQRLPGATSRWNRGKDLSWEPLRTERVCEVAYDHLQGDRFRHATTFQRWRPDKPPEPAATTSSR